MKVLLVIPGGGDPNYPEYKKAYDLIINQNNEVKIYGSVIILSLPGHKSYNQMHNVKTYWNCNDSATILCKKMEELDNDVTIKSFDIFSRSGGCFVTLMALKKYQPKKLDIINCYGPATFKSIKKLFKTDYVITKVNDINKGLFIDENTFSSFIPFEELVWEYNFSSQLNIGFGNEDPFSDWNYALIIENTVNSGEKGNIKVHKIEGNHVIDNFNPSYLRMIFKQSNENFFKTDN